MEDVLDVFEQPYDVEYPVVCFDEKSTQLLDDVRPPIPAKSGQVCREDSEYKRCGTANIMGWVEPLTGQRDAWVTEQRTAVDYALTLERIADAFPQAKKIKLIQDNLNTHKKSALYLVFSPEKAKMLAERFEFHYTPKHGSWLNPQEMEWSALAKQALKNRVGSREALQEAVQTWVTNRREKAVLIRWQFTTKDARLKLSRLYPVFSD